MSVLHRSNFGFTPENRVQPWDGVRTLFHIDFKLGLTIAELSSLWWAYKSASVSVSGTAHNTVGYSISYSISGTVYLGNKLGAGVADVWPFGTELDHPARFASPTIFTDYTVEGTGTLTFDDPLFDPEDLTPFFRLEMFYAVSGENTLFNTSDLLYYPSFRITVNPNTGTWSYSSRVNTASGTNPLITTCTVINSKAVDVFRSTVALGSVDSDTLSVSMSLNPW